MPSEVLFEDLTRAPSRYEFCIALEETPAQLDRLVSLLRGSAVASALRLAEQIEDAREGLDDRRRQRVAVIRENLANRA